MALPGYEFHVNDAEYFFEPCSGGIYPLSELLRKIMVHGESDDTEAIIDRLSSEYDSHIVRDSVQLLYEEGALSRQEGKDQEPSSQDRGATEIYLQVSHKCNLRCAYCYADGGHFGGPAAMMDESTARRAVDFLFDRAAQSDTCSLNFDGGEPFLNFSLVRRMVDYATNSAKNHNRTLLLNISSNGTLLTEKKVRYLKEHRVSLGLSIDGDRAAHDTARLTVDGKGSYGLLISAINQSKLFDYRPYTQALGTITTQTLNCLSAIKHIIDLGFKIIYFEPVGRQNKSCALDTRQLDELERQFSAIADFYAEELIAGNPLILRNFFRPLEKIHSRSKFGFRCSAGVRTFAVSPNGDIFPCYKFVGMADYIMGNVNEGTLDHAIIQRFSNNHVTYKKRCGQCWARYLCGGGCPYLGALSHGDIEAIDDIDCRFNKFLCQQSLEIYIRLSRENPEFLEKILGPRR